VEGANWARAKGTFQTLALIRPCMIEIAALNPDILLGLESRLMDYLG
jgi:hypothetical protein